MRVVKVTAIVYARYSSSRLPGKVLFSLGGSTILQLCIQKLRSIPGLDIVVATSDEASDAPIYDWCLRNNVEVFRGSLQNVAERTHSYLQISPCDAFFRINADSPFLQVDLLREAIAQYRRADSVDVISNVIERSYPYGISVELINTDTFRNNVPKFLGDEKEHITSFFYRNRDKFKIHVIRLDEDFSNCRFVLDTDDDWKFIQDLYSQNNNVFNFNLTELLQITKPK